MRFYRLVCASFLQLNHVIMLNYHTYTNMQFHCVRGGWLVPSSASQPASPASRQVRQMREDEWNKPLAWTERTQCAATPSISKCIWDLFIRSFGAKRVFTTRIEKISSESEKGEERQTECERRAKANNRPKRITAAIRHGKCHSMTFRFIAARFS